MMLIVRSKTLASSSSLPSSSSARAQSIDSAIEGGFFRSRARTMCTTSIIRRARIESRSTSERVVKEIISSTLPAMNRSRSRRSRSSPS